MGHFKKAIYLVKLIAKRKDMIVFFQNYKHRREDVDYTLILYILLLNLLIVHHSIFEIVLLLVLYYDKYT